MTCTKCQAKTTDGIALCERCCRTAEYALTNIGVYYSDLDLVPTARVKRHSNTAADPTGIEAARIVRDPVAEVDDEAVNTLSTWGRALADDRPTGMPPRAVPDLVPWLSGHLSSIATLGWAGDFASQLQVLERRLRKVAARADTGQFVGTCDNVTRPEQIHDGRTCGCSCHLGEEYDCDVPGGCGLEVVVLEPEVCGRPLYAPRDARLVRCQCGARWDVRARRHQLVRAAEDELATVAVIAHLAALWIGEPSVGKVRARLDQWVHRKRIKHVTTKVVDGRTRKVYRVGDVLDQLTDTPTSTDASA